MRALSHRIEFPRNHEAALVFAEPPAETDAWWLSRAQSPTFARRRIALSDACVHDLRASGGMSGQLLVEFNGATFDGASLAVGGGRYELDLGDALAQAMAEVLDEDDQLDVELVPGRSQPTLAIQPYLLDADG